MPAGSPDLCLFIPSFAGGGAERVMVTLANGAASMGLSVEMWAVSASGPYRGEVSSEVAILDFDAPRTVSAFPALVRTLRLRRPRALLSTLTHTNIAISFAHAMAGSSSRLALRAANTYSHASGGNTWLKGIAVPPLMRAAYKRTDAVVAVSMGVKDDLVANGVPADLISVIYNPVVGPDLLERSLERCDHPFFDGSGRPVIVSAGRLTAQKDFSLLVKSLKKVRERIDARLIVLGEGELRNALTDQVRLLGLADAVSLPGFVQNPFAYFRAADLFVLSSRWEGLPNTLIQAMACGTLVVSTDCPSGPREILEGGRWGRLIPIGRVDSLTEAIVETLQAPQKPDVRKRASDFNIMPAVKRYLEILDLDR